MIDRLAAHLKLTFYLCLLTAGAVWLFLKGAPAAGNALTHLYQWSIVGYYGTLITIAGVLLAPLSLFRFTRWAWPLLGWGWLVFLAIDTALFYLYRFHLDWLMVDMFLRDFRGMGIPVFLLVLYAGGALVLLGFVLWLYRSPRTGGRRQLRWFVPGLLLMLVGFVANSTINIWAVHFVRNEVTRYRPFLPVYYPVEKDAQAKGISEALPSIFPAAYGRREDLAGSSGGIVTYPLSKPVCTPKAAAPSILMIVVESWQAAAMNASVTPNVAKFASTSTRFDQHVSSGAATVPGLFGLMYGLHPTYFYLIKSAANSYPSQFTETLHDQHYRARVFTSSNLDGFSLKSMFFSHVSKDDYHAHASDEVLVQQYIDSLNSAEPRRFDFLFLTSSHASYNYPPAYARFKPLPTVEGGYALDRQADAVPYKNDYYNSLYYTDALIGKALAAAEQQGRLKNTWVIITGDHAEEFNENGLGYWGHGSNFSRWQTQTPMIIRAPAQSAGRLEKRLSLHQDVVPTLMRDALGCASAESAYSNGANLFHLPEKRGTVMASYMSSAYLVDGTVVDKAGAGRYGWRDMGKQAEQEDMTRLRSVMAEERRFIAP
ncbi:MAG: hypothetical protein RL404_1890 [Pseudomonadota bacterium]|jgi:membrane-anchored protein YejM (alkaline phosphatase superfamily)